MHAFTLALLVAASLAYALGLQRLWRRAGRGRGITRAHATAFAGGIAVLAIAAFGPLHELAEERLWAHMVQHELLMVLAAPLLVLSRPLGAFAHLLPLRVPRRLSDPLPAFSLHALAICLWHVPPLFLGAAQNEWLHFAQHASFLGSGILFWWSVFERADLGAFAALFGTMLYTAALGVLMSFARASWYAGYTLEDQQLAGLIMWIPAGLAYPAAALCIASQWLRRRSAA